MDFDFQRYIQNRTRSSGVNAAEDSGRVGYAFGRDARVLRTLERAKPVKLALDASTKLDAEGFREKILARAHKATAETDGALLTRFESAAVALGVAAPTLYVTDEAGDLGARALLFEGDPFVVVDKAVLGRFEGDELTFVLGRQIGHIQNDHTVFLTTDFALERFSEAFLGWVVRPARFAIASWSKFGDLTADRAGMLACGDLHVAARALMKLLVDGAIDGPLDMDAVLEEAEDNPRGSLMSQYTDRAPRLPGRLTALKYFEGAELFLDAQGREGGRSMTGVDRQVESIIKLW